jgi:uncharacterized membrane protein YeaQ/YmgE (transglycosylase-associated protein family)
MGIFLWIVLGLGVGSVAKVAMPGPDPLGMTGRSLLGIAGAVLGGLLSTVFVGGTVTGVDIHGLLTAAGGALIVLFGYRCVAIRAMA